MPERLQTVLIAAPVDERYVARLRDRFPEIEFRLIDRERAVDSIADADALICWTLSEEELVAATRLKWVHRCAAGVEEFLTPEFRARDLILTNSSGVHASNIAEHALSMMLAFARDLPTLNRAQRDHEWRQQAALGRVFELGGQTLLVIGYGQIGRALATRARSLGMRVIAVRRTLDAEPDGIVERLSPVSDLVELLPEADHVVNCLPHTRATQGLIDAAMFRAMRPGAHYYNVGRGPTTVTADLIAALEQGQLAGAGLDVVDPEPLPADSPIWDHPNIIMTAHTAGATPHMWDRVFAIVEDNVARFVAGEPLRNVIDQEQGY
jgi:D-2-hydroxyacid dehydrogenase (NADP+)